MTNKLTRSSDEKIFGVAAGMADYVNIDATIIRLLWILAVIFVAHEIALVYLLLALVLPKANGSASHFVEPEIIIEKDPASVA